MLSKKKMDVMAIINKYKWHCAAAAVVLVLVAILLLRSGGDSVCERGQCPLVAGNAKPTGNPFIQRFAAKCNPDIASILVETNDWDAVCEIIKSFPKAQCFKSIASVYYDVYVERDTEEMAKLMSSLEKHFATIQILHSIKWKEAEDKLPAEKTELDSAAEIKTPEKTESVEVQEEKADE
jgi:hypothetical protein